MTRLRCWLFGHQWVGTWKRQRTDREGEMAEFCSRCRLWRSLLEEDDYCGDFPLDGAR